ncbi:MAG TPA: hypothetical protein PK798_15035, partial [Flavobacteriales bacterium]|nr:hypothetical protein [Flavobacteriales bacterium]
KKVDCFPIEIKKFSSRDFQIYSSNSKRDNVYILIFILNASYSEFTIQYFPPQEVFGIDCRHIYYFRKL